LTTKFINLTEFHNLFTLTSWYICSKNVWKLKINLQYKKNTGEGWRRPFIPLVCPPKKIRTQY